MIAVARYVHTNLIARDWRRLAAFYESVFGCVPVMHLRMPGGAAAAPTLEIFNYSQLADGPSPEVNRPGFSHIAFSVDSVDAARAEFLGAGGSPVGDVVTLRTATGALVTWCYVADPEGNIVELQRWEHVSS